MRTDESTANMICGIVVLAVLWILFTFAGCADTPNVTAATTDTTYQADTTVKHTVIVRWSSEPNGCLFVSNKTRDVVHTAMWGDGSTKVDTLMVTHGDTLMFDFRIRWLIRAILSDTTVRCQP